MCDGSSACGCGCRALGEYAEQNGATQDGGGLVNGFFRALEAFDLRLFEAGRFDRPVAEGTDEVLDGAIKALDRCAATQNSDQKHSDVWMSLSSGRHVAFCCEV